MVGRVNVDAQLPPVPIESPAAPRSSDDAPSLEVGVGAFLLSGVGANGMLGVSPFMVNRIGESAFLRPSIALAEATGTPVHSTWAAARLDACMRISGNYAARSGIQLDLCGGGDLGFSYVASGTQAGSPAAGQTLPYFDLGPSVVLRAAIGETLALSLRGSAGFNVARVGFTDVTGARVEPPLGAFRFEVAFAWVRPRTAPEMVADRPAERLY
jgi:hypothetical protein